MQKFKSRWEIQHNWQLLFPILGLTLLLYSSYKIAGIFFNRHEASNIPYLIVLAIILFFFLLKFFLFCFKKLEKKWIVTYKWEMIRIFLVFAITGSSSVFISKPIIKLIGITKENLNVFVYWLLYVIIGFIFYQILLITIAWVFGQYSFFRDFLKRLAKRIGLGILIKE
jgi:ABC-type Co2+ transport system permease subunit